jgi:hypothetical protein
MPRLGVPVDIQSVRATFAQPAARLNPLGLRFAAPIAICCERVALGAESFAAYWQLDDAAGGRGEQLLRRDALIPLLRKVAREFEQQVTPWHAFTAAGVHQAEIDGEIVRQLRELERRFPCSHDLFGERHESARKKRAQTRHKRTARQR